MLIFKLSLFYLLRAPKHESGMAGCSDVLKGSHKVLPQSEKVKVLNLMRKEKMCKLRLLRSMVRADLLSVKL